MVSSENTSRNFGARWIGEILYDIDELKPAKSPAHRPGSGPSLRLATSSRCGAVAASGDIDGWRDDVVSDLKANWVHVFAAYLREQIRTLAYSIA